MSKRRFVFFLLLSCPFFLRAEDSLCVVQRTLRNSSFEKNFFNWVYLNPAQKFYRQTFILTEVKALMEYSGGNPVFLQAGDGSAFGTFDVDSYISSLENRRLWGRAYYKNGIKRNVVWNETSDYDWVYPYVLADSIGGDLKSEEYRFSGGYAREYGPITWGGTLDYRAAVEFRNIDPRPKNVVGELNASLGISLRTGNNYGVGFAVFATKYKQSNEVKFYSELGQSKTYHFTGMGMDYTRFSGSNNSTYYKGRKLGGNIDFASRRRKGFSGTFSYDHYSCKKIISSLNELPMASIYEHTAKYEIGYRTFDDSQVWGIKSTGAFSRRSGVENLFGDAANGIYPQIGKVEQYRHHAASADVVGMYEKTVEEKYRVSLLPEVSYKRQEFSYAYPFRSIAKNRLSGILPIRGGKIWKNGFLQAEARFGYSWSLDSDIVLSEPDITDSGILNMLYQNYRFFVADHILSDVSIQFSHRILGNYLLQVDVSWMRQRYADNVKTDFISCAVSFAF